MIGLLLVLVLPGGGDDTASVATTTTPAPAVTAASEDPRGPLGVPASCEDGGRPLFAREADALRLWKQCSVAELSNVTGASHSYLEFRDPAEASAALESARLFELDQGGYTACRDPGLDRVYSGQAWCAENANTIEIYWHDPDSRLMGLTTFASPRDDARQRRQGLVDHRVDRSGPVGSVDLVVDPDGLAILGDGVG